MDDMNGLMDLLPARDSNSAHQQLAVPDFYDVEHLDYQYIEKCNDVNELMELYAVLKSGKEGIWEEMETVLLNRVRLLNPKRVSRLIPAVSATSIIPSNELDIWAIELRALDLKSNSFLPSKPTVAPVRNSAVIATHNTIKDKTSGSTVSNTNPKTSTVTTESRIKSSDYRAWDSYDVEGQVQKIDDDNEDNATASAGTETSTARGTIKKSAPAQITSSSVIENLSTNVTVPANLTAQEVEYYAEQEKIKGNECLKCGDVDESIIYYTRSLSILPKANVYTNRSLAYFKKKDYESAENDATAALALKSPEFTLKSYIRRGNARMKRGKYHDSYLDFQSALLLDPENKDAIKGRDEAARKYHDVEGDNARKLPGETTGKRRMMIVEVNDDDEEENADIVVETTEAVEVVEEIITPGAVALSSLRAPPSVATATTPATDTKKYAPVPNPKYAPHAPIPNPKFVPMPKVKEEEEEQIASKTTVPLRIPTMNIIAPRVSAMKDLDTAPVQNPKFVVSKKDDEDEWGDFVSSATKVEPLRYDSGVQVEDLNAVHDEKEMRQSWSFDLLPCQYAPPQTDYEFKSIWSTLRYDRPRLGSWLFSIPPANLPRLLSGDSLGSVLVDIVAVFRGRCSAEPLIVWEYIKWLRQVPHVKDAMQGAFDWAAYENLKVTFDKLDGFLHDSVVFSVTAGTSQQDVNDARRWFLGQRAINPL
ncbi:hypothetical protein SmJEL517_g03129 [Synchytrium microbalum]|uniref:RNA-polymerase II-associated protein 3-like C-terminal domain-containing protein n=1 Tax=Synchytrium microbalum TaxID=1806994 RepID=A0A507C895_9FUNG|nr:uncharacterized protein SmJEL517_g03129 [Synchytrium microbalum]TPX34216.1 hypothetical protein SmJEL517_g03129 [Synchytrium microbalum]